MPRMYLYKSTILKLKRNLMALKEARDENGKLLLGRTDMFLEIAGCYLMRNRADSSLTEESDTICLRSTFPCILQPLSSLQIAWQAFVSCVTVLVTILHPYYLFFLLTIPAEFSFFNYVVTFIYLLDIIVHLSIGDKIEEGVPITFTQTSSQQIKSYWFLLDVLAVMPMFEFLGDGRFAGINKLLKVPKVFRHLQRLETVFVYYADAIRFMSYCLLIVVVCYLVAAVQQGFCCFWFHHCQVKDLNKEPYWSAGKLDDGPVGTRLYFSIYWAVSVVTFTSHKTSATTKASYRTQCFMMVLLEICTFVHILIEAAYSANIMVTEIVRDRYNTCIDTVKQFLIKNNVDPLLRHRFITYLQLCWFTDKAYSITHEKSSILFDLPIHVNQELLNMQRSKYILCIPFMKLLNKAMLKDVSSRARLFYTSPNEILLNTGDISNEIYVIKQGYCEVLNPDTKEVINLITVRNHFSDLECLLRIPAFYTVRAVTHVQVFSISRKQLEKTLTLPALRNAIRYARTLPEYESLQKRRQQFLTYTMPPNPANREWFPLPRKHEPDTAFLLPFTRLGFFAILRYVFPRFTIRPDSQYLKRYEWFRGACAFASANTFPLYSILWLQWPALFHILWGLDFCAYFDIIQRMLIGYFDEKGILVYHPASTAAHYIKGAFLLDLFACLPLEGLDAVRRRIYLKDNAYRQSMTCTILMYNRLLQMYRLPNALDILKDYIDRQDIIFIIKVFPLLLALVVVTTSIIVELSVDKWEVIGGGWRIEPAMDPVHGSWIIHRKYAVQYNITRDPWSAVLTTFYWVVYESTTTGFDLIEPTQLDMMCCLIIGMLLASVMTTYFSVRVISIRSNVNQALASYQDHIKDINVFMTREKVDQELQHEVLQYYEYVWDKTGGTDYRTVLKLCDQITLRTDAILHVYGQTFAKCPILYECDISLLRILGRAVRSMYFRAGMVIIDRMDVISHLYFIDYGTMDLRYHDDDDHIRTKLPRGSLLGNLENKKTVVCSSRFTACSNLHLLRINSQVFHKLIQDFPTVRILMKKYLPNNENYIIGSLTDPNKVMMVWKERVQSTAMIDARTSGFVKYFHPDCKAMQIYLIIVCMAVAYGDVYNAGFQCNNIILVGILYLLDLAFILKIVLTYLLPYVTEQESEARNALINSRQRYYKGEFRFDILSCVPLEIFCLLNEDPWSVFAYYRLNRCFRTITVNVCLSRYNEKLNINLSLITVFSVFIWFTFLLHCYTCVWVLLGSIEEQSSPNSSWHWMKKSPGPAEYVCGNEYLCAIYFIITTFTQNGSGDILAAQRSEVLFVCILMLSSTMIYMLYVGEFSNVIHYSSFRCFQFYSKYLELQEFLRNNRVASNLVLLTKAYSLHLWREARGLQIPHFLKTAPDVLRHRIMSAAYLHHLNAHPLFQDCEPAFLRQLTGFLEPFYYNDGMYVVREGEITNAMYFIHQGQVLEVDEDLEEIIQVYKKDQNFGTLQGLQRDTPYKLSYKTIIKSQVLTLALDKWEYLLTHFPLSKEKIYKNFGKEEEDKKEPKDEYEDEGQYKMPVKVPKTTQTDVKKKFGLTTASQGVVRTAESQSGLADEPLADKEGAPLADEEGAPLTGQTGAPFADQPGAPLADQTGAPLADKPGAPLAEAEGAPIVEGEGAPLEARRSEASIMAARQFAEKALSKVKKFGPPSQSSVGRPPLPLKTEASKETKPLKETVEPEFKWPINSRRKSSFAEPEPMKDEGGDEEEEEPPPQIQSGRRKSTVLGIDKNAIEEELRAISDDKGRSSGPKKESVNREEISPWPLFSRRKSSEQDFPKQPPTTTRLSKESESEEEPPPMPSYGRRKSTVHNVDKEAVEQELASLAQDADSGATTSAETKLPTITLDDWTPAQNKELDMNKAGDTSADETEMPVITLDDSPSVQDIELDTTKAGDITAVETKLPVLTLDDWTPAQDTKLDMTKAGDTTADETELPVSPLDDRASVQDIELDITKAGDTIADETELPVLRLDNRASVQDIELDMTKADDTKAAETKLPIFPVDDRASAQDIELYMIKAADTTTDETKLPVLPLDDRTSVPDVELNITKADDITADETILPVFPRDDRTLSIQDIELDMINADASSTPETKLPVDDRTPAQDIELDMTKAGDTTAAETKLPIFPPEDRTPAQDIKLDMTKAGDTTAAETKLPIFSPEDRTSAQDIELDVIKSPDQENTEQIYTMPASEMSEETAEDKQSLIQKVASKIKSSSIVKSLESLPRRLSRQSDEPGTSSKRESLVHKIKGFVKGESNVDLMKNRDALVEEQQNEDTLKSLQNIKSGQKIKSILDVKSLQDIKSVHDIKSLHEFAKTLTSVQSVTSEKSIKSIEKVASKSRSVISFNQTISTQEIRAKHGDDDVLEVSKTKHVPMSMLSFAGDILKEVPKAQEIPDEVLLFDKAKVKLDTSFIHSDDDADIKAAKDKSESSQAARAQSIFGVEDFIMQDKGGKKEEKKSAQDVREVAKPEKIESVSVVESEVELGTHSLEPGEVPDDQSLPSTSGGKESEKGKKK